MSTLTRFSFVAARVLIVGIAACLLVGACAAEGAPRVVKIGLIAPFEGPSRPLGYSVLHAVRLRIQQWNESGGAPQVELVALNDDGDAALAASLPDQLAIDPDILLVLGPPQGHTALASSEKLNELDLPTLSLAPLPGATATAVLPFAGTGDELEQVLSVHAPGAAPGWKAPITAPTIWLGDPLTLSETVRSNPQLVPAAGSVAAEEAFGAWAGAEADGMVWAMAVPVTLPADFPSAYEQVAGSPPTPLAALAYAATDEALSLLARYDSRLRLLKALPSIALPPIELFRRTPGACCVPIPSQP